MSGRLLIVAGEASGDLHGARLLSELSELVPGLAAFGLGGEELERAGLRRLADSHEISVVGISEALRVLPRARRIFRALLAEADRVRPQAAILVDFPEFNLRLARALKRRGIPIIYYVSPQIWAWRRRRVKTIARLVDLMLVLFPFEVEFYREHGVPVVHVGHPLIDEVPLLSQVWEREESGTRPYRVALLPGSRRSEVEALLPVMIGALANLARQLPVEAVLLRAPSIPRSLLERLGGHPEFPLEIVDGDRFRSLADSHLALCASGTATLEVGLLGTPLIVLYRLTSWTYQLAKVMVRVPHIALVNLVLGERAVPELIQSEASPRRIAAEAASLLTQPQAIHTLREKLSGLRTRLGAPGASRRAAREVADFLQRQEAA